MALHFRPSRNSHIGTADSIGLDVSIVSDNGANGAEYLGRVESWPEEVSVMTAR